MILLMSFCLDRRYTQSKITNRHVHTQSFFIWQIHHYPMTKTISLWLPLSHASLMTLMTLPAAPFYCMLPANDTIPTPPPPPPHFMKTAWSRVLWIQHSWHLHGWTFQQEFSLNKHRLMDMKQDKYLSPWGTISKTTLIYKISYKHYFPLHLWGGSN